MMRNSARRSNTLVLAMLALLLVLAACGDNDDDGVDDAEATPDPTATPAVENVEEQEQDSDDTLEGDEADTTTEPEGEQESVQQPSMQWDQPPAMQLEEGANYQAVLTTSHGEVVINLLEDDAPMTVNNFVFLAEQGYYSNVPFHRVISGFMIQTGDPTGTGRGGPGYRFDDEPVTRDYSPGTVAMANAGPNTNGSQFFIVHGDLRGQLPKNYTIFGEVVEGIEVVDAIANVGVQMSPSGEMSSPTEDVFIQSVEIRN
jgi:cyclophilin family peptidyl-prolyl cis-trans isomerase